LNENISGLGRAGEIKNVNDGYARNFLIPKGLADILNKHSLRAAEDVKAKAEKINQKDKKR
ncbi:MAG: bL9 family ribosomal protein, partial [Patescibacteria group bacterium]|nr:bL9 family ribosomal protein [Patescibacteria group bacterium]